MILVVLAFAELSTMMPVAGGIEAYTKVAMGMGPAAAGCLGTYKATARLVGQKLTTERTNKGLFVETMIEPS